MPNVAIRRVVQVASRKRRVLDEVVAKFSLYKHYSCAVIWNSCAVIRTVLLNRKLMTVWSEPKRRWPGESLITLRGSAILPPSRTREAAAQ